MNKRKKGIITTVVFMAVITVLVVAFFWSTVNKTTENAEQADVPTEISKLLEMDIDSSYPVTAREVVKLYSRIIIVLCNEHLEDEEFEKMIVNLRKLYSEELLEKNDFDSHLSSARDETIGYEAEGTKITGYQVEMADSAVEWIADGEKFYSIKAVYSMKTKNKTTRVYEEFLLKNEDGVWKIVGWRETDGAMMDTY